MLRNKPQALGGPESEYQLSHSNLTDCLSEKFQSHHLENIDDLKLIPGEVEASSP